MALSADTPLPRELGERNEYPVAAAATIYQGGAVGLAAGYARAYVAGDLFVGHAHAKADNSGGSAGDIKVEVYFGRYRLQVTVTGVAITDKGKTVYMSDDGTYVIAPVLTAQYTKVGRVVRYVTTNTCVVEFDTALPLQEVVEHPAVAELDCGSGADSAEHTLLSAWQNPAGLILMAAYGLVSEVFAGSSEDQGVVTVYDDDDNALCTLTPSDAGADALNDVIVGTNDLYSATTGDAAKVLAAGKGAYAKVTTATSGSGTAGKMKVYLITRPLL
jgi:hypothetical protein